LNNNFIVKLDPLGNYLNFTQVDFNSSSSIDLNISLITETLFSTSKKFNQRQSLSWNYSAPLNYQISFAELGLDSYSDIILAIERECEADKISIESFRMCLANNLTRWKFDEDSVSLISLPISESLTISYYKVNFTTKKIYSQFNPVRPISFILYTNN
jgi:hypothetical protein